MADLDIFSQDAFSLIEMTDNFMNTPYAPGLLGQLNLFQSRGVRTETVWVEEKDNDLNLISTSDRGDPPSPANTTNKRRVRDFRTVRTAKSDRITASEIQNIRAFGSSSELMQVQDEVNQRNLDLRQDQELTHEHMRLGAVQGIVYDADGSTVLWNWFTEFGVTQETEVAFDFANAAVGDIRQACAAIYRTMFRNLKLGNAVPNGAYIMGLASDSFYDALIRHAEVRETYLNQQEASELRKGYAWEEFSFGGIRFVNMRGTDDNSTVAVPADRCRFFPVGIPGLFQARFSPAERMELVNTPGQEVYEFTVPDRDRNSYVDLETYSYPLFMCKRPRTLMSGRIGA